MVRSQAADLKLILSAEVYLQGYDVESQRVKLMLLRICSASFAARYNLVCAESVKRVTVRRSFYHGVSAAVSTGWNELRRQGTMHIRCKTGQEFK